MIRNRANKAVSDEHLNFRYSTTDKYLQIFPYIGYEISHKEISVLIYTLKSVAKCNKNKTRKTNKNVLMFVM